MRKLVGLGLIVAALVVGGAATAVAEAAADNAAPIGQSIAPEAEAKAGSETCGGDGSCCTSCQVRKKYAKNKAADGEAGCPCQRARRAREAAAAAEAAKAAD